MYDLEWANKMCRDTHRTNVSAKESVREAAKVVVVYAGMMTSVIAVAIVLNFVKTHCENTTEIQKNSQDFQDTLNIKNYNSKQAGVNQK